MIATLECTFVTTLMVNRPTWTLIIKTSLGSAGFVVDRAGLADGCFGCPNLMLLSSGGKVFTRTSQTA